MSFIALCIQESDLNSKIEDTGKWSDIVIIRMCISQVGKSKSAISRLSVVLKWDLGVADKTCDLCVH